MAHYGIQATPTTARDTPAIAPDRARQIFEESPQGSRAEVLAHDSPAPMFQGAAGVIITCHRLTPSIRTRLKAC